jgi:putative ABC transport system ATP-binding protein
LHEVNGEGTTVIMVTHDVETTDDTRIMRIRDGVIE